MLNCMNQQPFVFECELPAHEGINDKFKVYFQTRVVYPVRLSKRGNPIYTLNRNIDNIKTIIRRTTV